MYLRIFDLELQSRPYKPSIWVHSLTDAPWLDSLSPKLRANPLLVFDKKEYPNPDIQLVGYCLESYIISQHRNVSSRDEAQRIFQQHQPGTRALAWLLESSRFDQLDLALNPRFLQSLVHLIRAQNATAYIWKWLLVDHVADILKGEDPKATRIWKSMVLRDLVESEVFWEDGPRGMNNALEAYLRASNLGRRSPSILGGINPNAGRWLSNQLSVSQNIGVNPNLYDSFVIHLSKWHIQQDFLAPRHMLGHPTRPNAIPMLDFLRRQALGNVSSEIDILFNSVDPKLKHMIFVALVHAAQLLLKDGDVQSAKWVVDHARTLNHPNWFYNAQVCMVVRPIRGATGYAQLSPQVDTARAREIRLAVEKVNKNT